MPETCPKCKENHAPESLCPPHEVRSSYPPPERGLCPAGKEICDSGFYPLNDSPTSVWMCRKHEYLGFCTKHHTDSTLCGEGCERRQGKETVQTFMDESGVEYYRHASIGGAWRNNRKAPEKPKLERDPDFTHPCPGCGKNVEWWHFGSDSYKHAGGLDDNGYECPGAAKRKAQEESTITIDATSLESIQRGLEDGGQHDLGTFQEKPEPVGEGYHSKVWIRENPGEAFDHIRSLQAENKELNDEVAFWMGEGDGTEWPPENKEWKEISQIPREQKTPEQLERQIELQRLITWKTDQKKQFERAEKVESEITRYREALERVQPFLCASDSDNGFGRACIKEAFNITQAALHPKEEALCEKCLQYPPDHPSKLCAGCEAYLEHEAY